MTTGNAGNGSIPPNGENPEDFSQYSLYQLVGLLRDHLSKFNAQGSNIPEGSKGNQLGALRQSLNELALSLSTQNKKLFNGGNPSFLIDKITYVITQLDTQEQFLNQWEKDRSIQSSTVLDILFEIRNRVPKGDELVSSGLDQTQFEYLNIIRRRSKYLKYDPDQQDDYLTFLYKLLADELGRNKKVNAELIPKKEKTVRRYVDTFLISAEFKPTASLRQKEDSDDTAQDPEGLVPVVNHHEINYEKAINVTNRGRESENKRNWKDALDKYRMANKILEPFMTRDQKYRKLYQNNLERISYCEQEHQKRKPSRRFLGLFSWF